MELSFQKSVKGRRGYLNPKSDVMVKGDIAAKYRRKNDAPLPEMSELDVVRHFTSLSQKNFSVDTNFYLAVAAEEFCEMAGVSIILYGFLLLGNRVRAAREHPAPAMPA